LALLAAGCGKSADEEDSGSSGGSSDGPGNSTGVTDDQILFGMATPISGNAASLGLDGQKGAEVFVKWINDKGGTNDRDWALTVQDDGFDPQKKIAAINYLIDEAKVFAVWGDVGSQASAALPIFEQTNVPYLFPYALDPTIYTPVKPSVFTIVPAAGAQEEPFGNWIAANTKSLKVGTLTLNSPDGIDAVKGIKASDLGKQVVAEQQFERTTTSWKPQLEALKSAGANAVLLHASDAWSAKIVTEAKEIGFDADFFGSSGSVTNAYFKLAGDNANGIRSVAFLAAPADVSVPGVKEFVDAFAKYEPGYIPGTFALHAWVGGLIIAEALGKVDGTPTREALIDALNNIEGFSTGGASGDVTFTEDNHLASDEVIVVEAKNNAWVQITNWMNADTAGDKDINLK
jgi:branched-chain amino acid transport system substrate-binding protein